MSYSVPTLDNIPLYIRSLTPVKTQKTIKQVVGKSLSELRVVGVSGQQWEIEVEGMILGTTAANLDTNRTNLEALDDTGVHAFVDGLHDGNYYIRSGSLKFEDSGENIPNAYYYSFSMVEE